MQKRFMLAVYIAHEMLRALGQIEYCCKIDYFGACRLHRWVFARHLLK